jgi:drug/metabolite transporter (DMT)-like permease
MAASSTAGPDRVRKGLAIATLGGLLYTLDLPLLRLAGLDKWTMVCARGIFLFLSISLVWYLFRRITGNKLPYIAGTAGVAVAIANSMASITFVGAVVEANAANVVFIFALVPVISIIMSRVFIGETAHAYTWLAVGLSFAGVTIIIWDSIEAGHWLGDVLALVSAISTATALTIIRSSGKNVATSVAVGSLISAVVAIVFFGVAPATLLQASPFGVPAWVWIALNGLVAIPLASALIANGPRFIPSVDVSMVFLLETVLTPIWIWLLFGEKPGLTVLIGGLIVIFTLIAHSAWRLGVSLRPAKGPDLGRL